MNNALHLMCSERSQRLSILTDSYRILLDRLNSMISTYLVWKNDVNSEVLLNDKSGVLSVMEHEGLAGILGDIMVSDSDPLLLVCH